MVRSTLEASRVRGILKKFGADREREEGGEGRREREDLMGTRFREDGSN